MTFEDAIIKSIKNFMSGKIPEKLNEITEEGLKYTPDYFDEFEQEIKANKNVDEEVIDGTS
jgi:hypothetical protein